MDQTFNAFPLTGTPTSQFASLADPTGTFFTTSDGQKVSWANVMNALQDAGFFDELFYTAGTGITITGTGIEGDPLVVSASTSSSGNATLVVAANLAELQGVGNANTIYFVYDTDGQGTNGIYSWNATAAAYQSMTPGGTGGSASATRSDISADGFTGKAKHAGGAPVLAKVSSGYYTLTVPTGSDFRGARLIAATGSSATDSNELTLDIISEDSEHEYCAVTAINLDTGLEITKSAGGVLPDYDDSVAGRVRITLANIGAFNFQLLLTPCA